MKPNIAISHPRALEMAPERRIRLWPLRAWISRPWLYSPYVSKPGCPAYVRTWYIERMLPSGAKGSCQSESLRTCVGMFPRIRAVRRQRRDRLYTGVCVLLLLCAAIAAISDAVRGSPFSAVGIVVGAYYLSEIRDGSWT